MFTGIVQGKAQLIDSDKKEGLYTYTFKFPDDQSNTRIGSSVAINGTCLTVVKVDQYQLTFDLMQETLRLTSLGQLKPGDVVNYEHAARIGDEIGGHLMSGHVHCTAPLVAMHTSENNLALIFEVPSEWSRYIFPKGFIGVNGASLTVGDCNAQQFTVNLIPETLRVTTFGDLQEGHLVNIEIDPQTQSIVDTIERVLPTLIRQQAATE
ncbi:riboflavin synthase subunit alpha [Hahella sp. CCB-MM4]|uniref:riboflavin synthase subunit alpha n=1 Tax=Hahella sp. (strain CCB-MM4) TaxID=1926491 RepID=UPI000B9A329B|nr:riboflavin synthase subunit alpha [Hahella sp. CCB-MM4]OZG73481.1 riboflavin synthase subunit alpha [Hahella sp. CCB-MM4]